MSVRPEALYDIASTDAYRALINKLADLQTSLMSDILRVAAKPVPSVEEIARASGRLEAITSFLNELKQVPKNAQSD
jgi:hypothetical protein